MTNGEKIREIFPNVQITECESYIQVMGKNYEFNNTYPKKWWNAEYKEPTTKNDLGVDAISRQQAIDAFPALLPNIGYNKKAITEVLQKLPPVIPQEPKTGHWYRQTNDYVDYYECSECGMAMGLYDVKSYCPNCGSRNEVEE